MSFQLTKWYLDAITAGGEVRIGYSAQLVAGAVKLRYASVLSASAKRAPTVTTRLRGAALPEQRGDVIDWRVAPLEVSGRWTTSVHPPLLLELLDEPGALTWSCLQPRADVELAHGGRTFSAVGYAECVTLRVPPWKLPIDELRWGRAHVGGHTLVWIDWRGPRKMKRVFLDGEAVDGEVTDDAIVTPRLRVGLERRMTLREGDVSSTVFARIPAVSRLLSRNKLKLTETKWLCVASAGQARGWAIHEIVRWH